MRETEEVWYEVIFRTKGVGEWKTCSNTLDTETEAIRYKRALKRQYPNNEYKIIKTTQIIEEVDEEDI